MVSSRTHIARLVDAEALVVLGVVCHRLALLVTDVGVVVDARLDASVQATSLNGAEIAVAGYLCAVCQPCNPLEEGIESIRLSCSLAPTANGPLQHSRST